MAAILQDQQVSIKTHFRSLFEVYERNLNGHRNHQIHALRLKAMAELETLPFPTRRDEDWKYTSVTRMLDPVYREGTPVSLAGSQVDAFSIQNLQANRLVFINGVFNAEHSNLEGLPDGVVVKPISEALQIEAFRANIEENLTTQSNNINGAFLALNTAFAKNGYFIYVPKNTVVEQPIHLSYIAAPDEQPFFCHPQLIVVADRNSQLSLLESYNALEGTGVYFTNAVSRFILKENAIVYHYKLQNEGLEAFQVNNTFVEQDRKSNFSSFAVDLGGQIVRNNLSAVHKGQNLETHFYGAYLGTGNQHIDNQTFIDHALPHCQSNELYKGVLADKARGVFNGKVIVRPDAQKTNAYQQNSSLVLSPTAVMDAKPQLEIFADDVRCSHGATIGQLDETSVFYLRSRGLNNEQARALLKHAFLKEVLDNMPSDAIRNAFDELVMKKLG